MKFITLVLLCLAQFSLLIHAAVQPVSVASGTFAPPAGGSGDSLAPVMSSDGRYVLFASLANNLAESSNGTQIPTLSTPKMNVFLRDRTNGTTTLVSMDIAGTDGGNGDSWPSAISSNGQYALFESTAGNLTTNNLAGTSQVFLRDVVNGATILISAGSNGTAPNGVSRSSVMTPDGRYVAFVSAASNLVSGDTNRIPDVFLRDTQAGTTTLVSVGAQSTSVAAAGGSCELPAISTNGRYVAFYSTATNLVAGAPTNGEIFLRDVAGGTTAWVSSNAHAAMYSAHGTSNAISCNFSLSDDGQYVAYEACPLTNGVSSSLLGGVILRYSLATGLTETVSSSALGFLSGTELNTRNLDMTPDGRFIAFIANVGSAFGKTSVYVWDSQSNTTTLASGNAGGVVPATSLCYWPAMDSSGRYIAFLANASSLTTNSPAAGINLFLRDMQAGVTTWADITSYAASSPESLMTFPRLSADGNSVAFESLGEGLVANDSNHVYNVFVRNVPASTTELVSASLPALASITPDGASEIDACCVSTNGRYVAFCSEADNLVPGDTNGYRDVFVRDILAGTNYLASANRNGTGSGNGPSTSPAISGNGRYVVFTSSANNLVDNDTNNARDVFLRDLESNTTTLVSVNTNNNGPGNGSSYSPSISVDGRYVLFQSTAGNLAAGSVSNSAGNLYWRDMQIGMTRAITTYSGSSTVGKMAAMTPDGQYVAYEDLQGPATVDLWSAQSGKNIYTNSTAPPGGPIVISPSGTRIGCYGTSQAWAIDTVANTSLALGTVPLSSHATMQFSTDSQYLVYVARPTGFSNQIYLYSYATGSNILVSQNYSSGGGGNGNSDSPTISGDGLFVAYRSFANNLVPGDTNGLPDLFLYDCLAETTTLLTSDLVGYGPANNRSLSPIFSGTGETLIFESWASDLASGDYNEWGNLFAFQPFSSSPTNSDGSFVIQNPTFSGINWHNGAALAPTFTWLTTPGTSYQVQFKNNLTDPAWQNLTNNVSIVGGEGYAIDLAPASAQRFYRVIALQ